MILCRNCGAENKIGQTNCVECKVSLTPNIKVDPQVVDFGHLKIGKSKSKRVAVKRIGDGKLSIREVIPDGDCNSWIKVSPPNYEGDHQEFHFTVTADAANLSAGHHKGSVAFSSDMGKEVARVSVKIGQTWKERLNETTKSHKGLIAIIVLLIGILSLLLQSQIPKLLDSPPVLTSIEVIFPNGKSGAISGDRVTLVASASDSASEILDLNYQWKCVPEAGQIEGEGARVTLQLSPTVFGVVKVKLRVTDPYGKHDERSEGETSIMVILPPPPPPPPPLPRLHVNITADQTRVRPGQRVMLTAHTFDDQRGVVSKPLYGWERIAGVLMVQRRNAEGNLVWEVIEEQKEGEVDTVWLNTTGINPGITMVRVTAKTGDVKTGDYREAFKEIWITIIRPRVAHRHRPVRPPPGASTVLRALPRNQR